MSESGLAETAILARRRALSSIPSIVPGRSRPSRPTFWRYMPRERVGTRLRRQSQGGQSQPVVSRLLLDSSWKAPVANRRWRILRSGDFPSTWRASIPMAFAIVTNS